MKKQLARYKALLKLGIFTTNDLKLVSRLECEICVLLMAIIAYLKQGGFIV